MPCETERISSSATTASATFAASAYYVEVHNQGANKIFVNFNSTAATTDFQIDANETLRIFGAVASVHTICSGGETATVQIMGLT